MRGSFYSGLVLCLAGLAGPAAAAPAAAACQMQQFGEMAVSTEGGALTVEAKINGHPVRLIVDTGSETTILFRNSADSLGLKWSTPGTATIYGVGGATSLGTAQVKEFTLAGVTARNFDIPVAGNVHDSVAHGILGARLLLQGDLEFDVAHGKIRFLRPKDCVNEQVVYWGGAYTVTPMLQTRLEKQIDVRVMVSGQPVRAEIDSGAVVSTLTANAARRVGFKTSPSAAPAGPSVQGLTGAPVQTRVEVFPTFTFGDETIKNAKIEIADMFAAATEVPIGSMLPQTVIEFPEMLLGADFLKSHRVYVAMSQRKVYASYTGGPVFQDRGQTVTRPEPPKP